MRLRDATASSDDCLADRLPALKIRHPATALHGLYYLVGRRMHEVKVIQITKRIGEELSGTMLQDRANLGFLLLARGIVDAA